VRHSARTQEDRATLVSGDGDADDKDGEIKDEDDDEKNALRMRSPVRSLTHRFTSKTMRCSAITDQDLRAATAYQVTSNPGDRASTPP
jgi:hypothetical protein